MLLILEKPEELRYSELMRVCEQSSRLTGSERYSNRSDIEQLLLAEQDMYCYIQEEMMHGLKVAVWSVQGTYQSVLRLERYQDGLLIAGLETAPDARGKGYADCLLRSVVKEFQSVTLYSHIYNDNDISIHLHIKNGFVKLNSTAHFLDDTLSTDAHTYVHDP